MTDQCAAEAVLEGRVGTPGHGLPGRGAGQLGDAAAEQGGGGGADVGELALEVERAVALRQPFEEVRRGQRLGRIPAAGRLLRQSARCRSRTNGVAGIGGVAQEPPQAATDGGNPIGRRTGGPGGVGAGPQKQQRTPDPGAGDDRCRGRRAVVRKCEGRTRIAPGELIGGAQPDEPPLAQRLRHRNRTGQRHPGPGRQIFRRQPCGHLQPQRVPVGGHQEHRTREHARVVHGELQQPIQLRPANRSGGG